MMQKIFMFAYKVVKKLYRSVLFPIDWMLTYIMLYGNGAKFSNFRSIGVPKIYVLGGELIVGKNFKMNNREYASPAGRFLACSICVGKNAKLTIGNNVGMSSTAMMCFGNSEIGDNVLIGTNVVIYDSDFHSIDPKSRLIAKNDIENMVVRPIKIEKNVFIGGHSTILKGVRIGENSIVGACSVVTKDIPPNEIWAGNPAKFIRKISA